MYEPTYLTQDEAAALCTKSRDTIRRHRRNGHLPNSRQRPDGTMEVAVADLVAAGLLDPLLSTPDVTQVASRSRAERDLVATRQELAVVESRHDALRDALSSAHEQIEFLRSTLRKAGLA
jgi:hypothetical protein